MIIPEKTAHWYTRAGIPCHQVKAKSHPGMKAVTLREAREMDLLPSVTSILSIIAKPALEAWKVEQGIIAALTLPRLPDEAMDVFASRVVQDMGEQVGEAASFGSRIHAGIELILTTGEVSQDDPEIVPWLMHINQWIKANVQSIQGVELVVVSQRGYAGRLDLACTLKDIGEAVVDFKTQGVKKGKPAFYDEWVLQLAAYARALAPIEDQPQHRLVSVVVDSGQAGPPCVKVWDSNDQDWISFRSAFQLWKYLKNYEPAKPAHA